MSAGGLVERFGFSVRVLLLDRSRKEAPESVRKVLVLAFGFFGRLN